LNNTAQVEAVLAKFDSDGDGKLDYEEFKKLIQKKKK
jgi:Ca2+-binding EF-hand superfamily protein